MNRYRLSALLPVAVLAVALAACSKGKLETRPRIELKEMNATEIFPGMELVITIEYEDKEGDLGNGTLTYIRERLNILPIPDAASNDKIDTISSPLPDFPKAVTGEVDVIIPYGFLSEDPFDNDTMQFKIFVTDLGGNVSDTITTPVVVERIN